MVATVPLDHHTPQHASQESITILQEERPKQIVLHVILDTTVPVQILRIPPIVAMAATIVLVDPQPPSSFQLPPGISLLLARMKKRNATLVPTSNHRSKSRAISAEKGFIAPTVG